MNKQKIITIVISILLAYFFYNLCSFDTEDYCIEDGDCNEGYIFNGRPIDKEFCKELDGTWHINPKHKNYCIIKDVHEKLNKSPSSL